MIARARGMMAPARQIRINRTILLLPPRVHLAPSRLSRRGKSEEVVIRIELKMLILSQMTKPQTVFLIFPFQLVFTENLLIL